MICIHCMNAGCIHCREVRLEQERKAKQRARLTDEERQTFGLVVHPLIPSFIPKQRNERPRPVFALQSVLPINFQLPAVPQKVTVGA